MSKTYLIKPISNWENSENLVKNWFSKMSENPEKCETEKIRIVCGKEEKADYYLIINYPNDHTFYEPSKTIVIQAEPWCKESYQNWGVKTWGFWSCPDKNLFLQVRNHKTYLNVLHWEIEKTLSELKTEKIEKNKVISTVTTSKYFDPGHKIRIDLLKYLESKNFFIDIYGYDNNFNFKGYKGTHSLGNKNEGILPYKYYFHCENNSEYNFITEKIWDSILSECVIFYWGCPNISDYIDPACYILLDSLNSEKNYEIIKTSIENNEWEKRINRIRKQKKFILENYNIFNVLKQIIASEEETPIYIWIHCCSKGQGLNILDEQLKRIRKSSLYNRVKKIHVGIVGNYKALDCFVSDKIKVDKIDENENETEFKTMKTFLNRYLQKESKILYIHTKGVSHPNDKKSRDWRHMMEYFLIDRWETALQKLENNDIVGCNLHLNEKEGLTPTHFSGNFWFCNGNYLEKRKDDLGKNSFFYDHSINSYKKTDIYISSNMFPSVEFWIADSEHCKPFSLHDSKINHYFSEYDIEKYKLE